MPRLLVEKGPDRGKSVTVQVGGQIIAGRDKSVSLQLSDQMASRRHFLIASRNGVFGLKDLESANGTLLNGRPAEGARRLKYGDSIQVGETLMSWLSDDQTKTHGGLIGQQIAGYRIEERLGRGAMGTVYRATQLSLGRTVALKVLAHELVKDEKFCEMFIKEARAAGGLNHPNIIQVYDVGDEDDTYYFSMEFASRGSVQEELGRRKSIKLPRAVRIIKDACAALDYAERKGLVHRDIKPDNLMVTEDETVKLGDLGLAMSAQELQAEQDGVFGTPHYIAPEQAMGKSIDHRADIYALGATFYRMLSGRTLFQGATVKEILKKQVREPHTPVTEHVHDCPKAISGIIDRMVAKNPDERYQHAAQITADLEDWESMAARKGFLDSAAFSRAPTRLSPEDSQLLADHARRQKLLIAGVVTFICLVAAAVSIWFFVLADENTTPANNTASDVKRTGTTDPDPPDEDVDSTELPPEVRAANSRLRDELIFVNHLVGEDRSPGVPEYNEAVDRLDKAKENWPDASPDWRQRIDDRKAAIEATLNEIEQAVHQAENEWQQVRREALDRIDNFKTLGAREVIQEFIEKHKQSGLDGVQEVVDKAEQWLVETYPTQCSETISGFEVQVERELAAAEELDPAARVKAVEDILEDVREAADACDDPTYQPRLDKSAKTIDSGLISLRGEAEEAERQAVAEALERAQESLKEVLEECRRDIARGAFKSAGERLDNWQAANEDFTKYGEREQFQPIVREIKRRREQTTLEHQALRRLSLPDLTTQNAILREHPWPRHVSEFLGGERYFLHFSVEPAISDQQWSAEVDSKDGRVRALKAAELDEPGKRRGLAGAISHLVRHDDETRAAMMQKVGSVPAMAGLFAWMAELKAFDAGFPLIEHAFNNTPPDDPGYHVVREYYASGLIGKAEAHTERGEDSEAAKLLRTLAEDFADTRANQGRE